MKKLLLIVSFFAMLLSNCFKLDIVEASSEEVVQECSEKYDSIVRIVDNYNVFRGNGVVYKIDEEYMYIITSSFIVSDSLNFGAIFENEQYERAIILGEDKVNEIAVFRTNKINNILPACFANSNYIEKGEIQELRGYLDKDVSFYGKTIVSNVGENVAKNGYINIYKNVLDITISEELLGIVSFDRLGRVSGIVSGIKEYGGTYVVESNRALKIADSIVKSGKYDANYIKYSVVDYNSLSNGLKSSYGVNKNVKNGVVIVTFKPLAFLFGGLNQGMTIVAVNGVYVNNGYEMDKQLLRYNKGSKVCLKVIKTNGKEKYYFVEI